MDIKKVNYKNYRVEPGEAHYMVIATNTQTNREEVIKRYTHKSHAYKYVYTIDRKFEIHSNKLKVIFKTRGLKINQVSKDIHIGYNTLSSWVSNRKQPSKGNLHLLAQYLGLKVEDLINF